MVHETLNGNYQQTNLKNESDEYLKKREELRQAELELMQQRERVAALRRDLPRGATVQDYEFEEVSANPQARDRVGSVRLSELFTSPERSLVIYHFMFGKQNAKPCSMCTMVIDGWNGVAHHLAQNVDVAIAAAAGPGELREFGRTREWHRLRLLSCVGNTFKYDLGSEDRDGNQDSMVSVFTKTSEGNVRHFYSLHPAFSHEIPERGQDLLCPVYNVLDLTPQGRGNWSASLDYSPKMSPMTETAQPVELRKARAKGR